MKTKYLLCGGLIALLLTFIAGAAYAYADSDVIHACVRDNGQVRIVNLASACTGKETHIEWNIVGPQGPQGEQGLPGNLALANQSCPPSTSVTGFAADGSLICSTYVPPLTPVPPNPNIDNDQDGYTMNGGDCDDNNNARHPGATEIVNGVDDDCDGVIDE